VGFLEARGWPEKTNQMGRLSRTIHKIAIPCSVLRVIDIKKSVFMLDYDCLSMGGQKINMFREAQYEFSFGFLMAEFSMQTKRAVAVVELDVIGNAAENPQRTHSSNKWLESVLEKLASC